MSDSGKMSNQAKLSHCPNSVSDGFVLFPAGVRGQFPDSIHSTYK